MNSYISSDLNNLKHCIVPFLTVSAGYKNMKLASVCHILESEEICALYTISQQV